MWQEFATAWLALGAHPFWIRVVFNLGVSVILCMLLVAGYIAYDIAADIMLGVYHIVYRLWKNGWSWHPISDDALRR